MTNGKCEDGYYVNICGFEFLYCISYAWNGFYNTNSESRKYELHAIQEHLKYDIDISLWCSVMKGILVKKFYESRQMVHMG